MTRSKDGAFWTVLGDDDVHVLSVGGKPVAAVYLDDGRITSALSDHYEEDCPHDGYWGLDDERRFEMAKAWCLERFVP